MVPVSVQLKHSFCPWRGPLNLRFKAHELNIIYTEPFCQRKVHRCIPVLKLQVSLILACCSQALSAAMSCTSPSHLFQANLQKSVSYLELEINIYMCTDYLCKIIVLQLRLHVLIGNSECPAHFEITILETPKIVLCRRYYNQLIHLVKEKGIEAATLFCKLSLQMFKSQSVAIIFFLFKSNL